MDLLKTDQLGERIRTIAGMPVTRQLLVMIGLAVSVAIGVAVVLWSREPVYGPLYTQLSAGDASEIVSALQERGVPYRVDQASGTILVPANRMHETRIGLAAAGLPKTAGVGFELLDGQATFGESELMESVRHQRVLEGELSRTIGSLADVQGVRVHLALPKRSLFVREREKPSASVLVNLHPGRVLEPVQVQAIVHLVSSSVSSLERNRVTVIDQSGRLLSANQEDSRLEASMDQFNYTRRLEDAFTRRVEEILTPILGPGRVRAQVVADLDFTVVESTEEAYDRERQVLRSEQLSEQRTKGPAFAGGIPGALSNQPPPGGNLESGGAAGGSEGTESDSRTSTRNYEIDRTVRHVRQPTGAVKRLSVAVVVDELMTTDAEGKPVPAPMSAEQREDLTRLVKKAVGFDEARGDSVHIVSASFQAGEAASIEEPPVWERPWFWDLVKQGTGILLVVLLALGVLRPLMRSLSPQAQGVAGGGDAVLAGAVAGAGGMGVVLGGQGGVAALTGPDGMVADQLSVSPQAQGIIGKLTAPKEYEQQVARAQSMIEEDPRLAANLVKEWLASDR